MSATTAQRKPVSRKKDIKIKKKQTNKKIKPGMVVHNFNPVLGRQTDF